MFAKLDKLAQTVLQVLQIDMIASPIGDIFVVTDGDRLCALDFADFEARMRALLERRYGRFELQTRSNPQGFSDRLRAYFDGDRLSLDAIPVNTGGTAFQQQVWQALRGILFSRDRPNCL
jgi:methylated-DNA-[protein]-cysteine S-methyltransferase